MAVTDFFEDFVAIDYRSKSDGMGGVIWETVEGARFRAGIYLNTSNDAQMAYQTGTKALFTITTLKNVELEQNDVVRRERDGRTYRIIGNAIDNTAPDKAVNVPIRTVQAEVVTL